MSRPGQGPLSSTPGADLPGGRLSERRPSGPGWMQLPTPRTLASGTHAASMWRRGAVSVISALSLAEAPDGSGRNILQWHVSVSRFGSRPTDRDVRHAREAFRLQGFEEDNHHPGGARHFWQPVEPAERVDCECKTTEDTIVERDGYRWTNPNNGEPCRGCEYEQLLGTPCPIHRAVRGADGFPLLVPSPSRTADADAAIGQPGSTAPRDAEVAPLGGGKRGDTSEGET